MIKKDNKYYLTKEEVINIGIDLPSLFSGAVDGFGEDKRVELMIKRVTNAVYNFIQTSTHNGAMLVDLFNENTDDVQYCLEEQLNYMVLNGDFALMSGYTGKDFMIERQRLREAKVCDNVVTYLMANGYLYNGYQNWGAENVD